MRDESGGAPAASSVNIRASSAPPIRPPGGGVKSTFFPRLSGARLEELVQLQLATNPLDMPPTVAYGPPIPCLAVPTDPGPLEADPILQIATKRQIRAEAISMCDFLAGMNQFGPPPPTNLFERPLQTPAQLQAIDLLAMLPDEPREKPENDADLYDLDPDEEERLAAERAAEEEEGSGPGGSPDGMRAGVGGMKLLGKLKRKSKKSKKNKEEEAAEAAELEMREQLEIEAEAEAEREAAMGAAALSKARRRKLKMAGKMGVLASNLSPVRSEGEESPGPHSDGELQQALLQASDAGDGDEEYDEEMADAPDSKGRLRKGKKKKRRSKSRDSDSGGDGDGDEPPANTPNAIRPPEDGLLSPESDRRGGEWERPSRDFDLYVPHAGGAPGEEPVVGLSVASSDLGELGDLGNEDDEDAQVSSWSARGGHGAVYVRARTARSTPHRAHERVWRRPIRRTRAMRQRSG